MPAFYNVRYKQGYSLQ